MKKITFILSLFFSAMMFFPVNAQNLLAGWDGNGKTGTGSRPDSIGWLSDTQTAIPWSVANSSGGSRFRDYNVSGGFTGFTNESDGSTSTTRQLMFRWDGSAYSKSYYAYPVTLQACKMYTFSFDYVCGGSATPPQNITVGISTTVSGTGRLSSQTFTSTSKNNVYRHGTYTFSSTAAGTYYITFNGAWAWFGVTNLNLSLSTDLNIVYNPASIAFSNVNKSAQITVTGNALTNDISIAAPAGITLDKTTIAAADAPCGVTFTASLNYSTPLTADSITLTSGTMVKKIPFTYTKPNLSVFEQNIEVEKNGNTYPLNVLSVNNTVDSVYVIPSKGFTVSKNNYAASDFVNGSLSINVGSTALAGTSGTLILKGTNSVVFDTVNVSAVVPYTRYYIRQNTSNLLLSNLSGGSAPVIRDSLGLVSQKFFFRKVNVSPASSVDTVYIVQDSLYRVMRKSTANAWSTDFGVPSANSKWIKKYLGNGLFSLINTVTNLALGSDLLTSGSGLYDNKTWVAGGNTEWKIISTTSNQNLMAGWDGNGKTGAGSRPDSIGWFSDTQSAIPWNTANSTSGSRFRDFSVTNGFTGFTNEADGSISSTRQLMFRWDGSAYSKSYYAYPVNLETGKTYTLSFDYVCGGSATPPQNITVGISTTVSGTGRLSSQTFASTNKNTVFRHGTYTFTTTKTGINYITFNGAWAWFAVTNLNMTVDNNPNILVSQSSLALSNVNKSAMVTVNGNALTSDITITAPPSITLDKTTINAAAAQSGVSFTASLNYTAPLTTDTITLTSGTLVKKIAISYSKPSLSVYEQNIEVENNGNLYPLNVLSVNNTVDSLYVIPSVGFSVSKNNFAASDFVSGSLNLYVGSTASVGTSGTLILKGTNSVIFDTIHVSMVTPYTRYYIRQNTSKLLLSNLTGGSAPVIRDSLGLRSQKFFFRKVNVSTASMTDTVYIVQDSLYRVLRKSTANAWTTEFGIPSANSKWTKQDLGNGLCTLTNTVTNLVLGSDAIVSGSGLYDNKTWTAGNNTEWLLLAVSSVPTAVNLPFSQMKVLVNNHNITVLGVYSYAIYNVQGMKVADIRNNNSGTVVSLNQGVYIVKSPSQVQKVIVE